MVVPPTEAGAGPVPVRLVGDVSTLRALSDPLRLAILQLLMRNAHHGPPVLTVKEIAAQLDEPPTKLYRHVKQLEACGLVEVAETRLVSGIVEHRYRAGQLTLRWDGGLLGQPDDPSDLLGVDTASFETFYSDYVADIAAGKVRLGQSASPATSYRRPIGAVIEARLPPDRAAQLRNRLAALVDEYFEASDAEDGVPVRLSLIFYSPEE